MGDIRTASNIVISIDSDSDIEINKYYEHLKGEIIMRKTPNLDITKILNGKTNDDELNNLKSALKSYMDSRGMDFKDTKDQVDLTLIIFCLFDIEENGFLEYISRLNIMQLKRMGIDDIQNQGTFH